MEELGCEIDFADVGHHQDDRLAYSLTKLFALAFYFAKVFFDLINTILSVLWPLGHLKCSVFTKGVHKN